MKKNILILAAGLLSAIGSAQVTTPGNEYVVQGIYSPTLKDATKIDLRPSPSTPFCPSPGAFDVMPTK